MDAQIARCNENLPMLGQSSQLINSITPSIPELQEGLAASCSLQGFLHVDGLESSEARKAYSRNMIEFQACPAKGRVRISEMRQLQRKLWIDGHPSPEDI